MHGTGNQQLFLQLHVPSNASKNPPNIEKTYHIAKRDMTEKKMAKIVFVVLLYVYDGHEEYYIYRKRMF